MLDAKFCFLFSFHFLPPTLLSPVATRLNLCDRFVVVVIIVVLYPALKLLHLPFLTIFRTYWPWSPTTCYFLYPQYILATYYTHNAL